MTSPRDRMPPISRPGDPREREAAGAGPRPDGLAAADEASPAMPRGAGRPPTADELARAGAPHDVGRIRIHDDAEAATLADAFDAQAYAWGSRVVVGRHVPRPIPDSVLGHEFRHVGQERPGGVPGTVMRLPREPTGLPLEAEVYPHWSTPLRSRPEHDAPRLADLPRHQRVTVEGGQGWLRVTTVLNGTTLSGFVSHEQLRAVTAVPPEPEPEPENTKPPLTGTTSEASGLNVRSSPGASGEIIGKLVYKTMNVQVLDSAVVTDKLGRKLWLKVRFSPADFQSLVMAESIRRFGEGTTTDQAAPPVPDEGWVSESALAVTAMPWRDFLTLVRAFEAQYATETVTQRLSRLRQIGEEPDVTANGVVGAGGDLPNQVNRGDRTADPDRWTLLYEAKQVELPDGEIVDIHHMLLGAESLIDDGRRSEDRLTALGSVGQSYAAATWSGDLGGAAADLVWHRSADWESSRGISAPTEAELDAFYFSTRASDQDLLGDLDAWGSYQSLPAADEERPMVTSIEQFLTFTYGSGEPGLDTGSLTRSLVRARGIANLLRHYGFTEATGLAKDTEAVARMENQVLIFTKAWSRKNYAEAAKKALEKKSLPTPADDQALAAAAHRMTLLFLDWLEKQARTYSVDLTE